MTKQNQVHMPELETTVRLYQSPAHEGLLGFADLVIGGSFVIKGIRIVRAKEGENSGEAFVSFPSRRGSGESADRYFDVAHPITAEARGAASELILAAYQEALAKGS